MNDSSAAVHQHQRHAWIDLSGDLLLEELQLLLQLLMEQEAGRQTGADKYERRASRPPCRNGLREGSWETRVGEIPRSRQSCALGGVCKPSGSEAAGGAHC